MPVGELVEIVPDYGFGQLHVLRPLLGMQLEKQTFPQVPRSDADRLEFLDHLDHPEDLLRVGIDIRPERQVVHYAVDIPAEIAILVQAADDECCNIVFVLGKVPVPQLLHEALGETFLYRESIVLRTLVLAVIVDPELVGRNIVAVVNLIDGHILRLVVVIILVRSRRIVEHGILLKFSLHTLLQLLDRKLYQFDSLDLKRRKLLLLLEFESLLEHVSSC